MNSTQPIISAHDIEFDYAAVPADVVADLRWRTDRIRSRISRQVSDIIAIGHDLLLTKENLDHGLFTKWIAIELRMEIRTAQRFMAAARLADEAKNDTVSLLPPATIYRLAAKSTPPEIRNQVLDRVANGDVPTDSEVARIIRADEKSRLVAKQEAERKEETAAQRRRRQRLFKERAIAEERRAEEQKREEQAKAKIADLVDKLVSAVPRDLVRETFAAVESLFEKHSCAVFWIERAVRQSLREHARTDDDNPHPTDIPAEFRRVQQ